MKDIKFVKYEAVSDFNYCNGKLYLEVDGKEWVGNNVLDHDFGFYFDENYDEIYYDGHWILNENYFKEFNEEEKKVIFKLVNDNMEAHCCGGCA